MSCAWKKSTRIPTTSSRQLPFLAPSLLAPALAFPAKKIGAFVKIFAREQYNTDTNASADTNHN